MSQETVEWVRRAYDAFARRDWDRIGELLDPDIDFRTTVEAASGRGGVEAWIRQADELIEDFTIEVEEVVEAGDDRVVVLAYEHGRGRGSGVQIEQRLAHVWTIRDGRAVAVESFVEREAGLAAAGLR
jgi:ketosteroid isomerase-like protein